MQLQHKFILQNEMLIAAARKSKVDIWFGWHFAKEFYD